MFDSHKIAIYEFERIGESELRYKIAHGTFFGNHALATEWLRQQEEARSSELSSRRDKREEETLSIARKARSEARIANIIAISAIILSIATTIGIAIFQWLTKK